MRAVLVVALLVPASALAVPMELPHQGRLLDATGVPLTGQQTLDFSLFASAQGGTAIWSESHTVDVDNGYFSVSLGSASPIDADDFDGSTLYVETTVNGTALPRQAVASVAYALRAGIATDLVGGTVDATSISVGGTQVIDSSGTFMGTLSGSTLDDLPCLTDQVPLYDGSQWGCATVSGSGGPVTWNDISGIPVDLVDGDDDTLAAMTTCADGDVAGFISSFGWGCITPRTDSEVIGLAEGQALDLTDGSTVDGDLIVTASDLAAIAGSGSWADLVGIPSDIADGDADTQLDEAAVDAFVANNGYAMDADIHALGKSGDWTDLQNIPGDIADGDADTQLDEAAVDAFVANNGYAADADIHALGKSGDWADLQNIPGDIADGDADTQLDEAAVDGFVSNNGYAAASSLATVATSGDYNDLSNLPSRNYEWCKFSNGGDYNVTGHSDNTDINMHCNFAISGNYDVRMEYCVNFQQSGGGNGGVYARMWLDDSSFDSSPGYWQYNNPQDNKHTNLCGQIVIPASSLAAGTRKFEIRPFMHSCGSCSYHFRSSSIYLEELR